MILSAHQPLYLPWLGFFHKISQADVFCIFDSVQYTRKDFINRNRIKTKDGIKWLTVPVRSTNHHDLKIHEAEIVEGDWHTKHFKTIQQSYLKSKFYKKYIDEIEYIYTKKAYTKITEINQEFIEFGMRSFDIQKTKIVYAKQYNFEGDKSDLVLDMCRKLGAKTYIFGEQGINYANISSFENEKIKLIFQNFKHPIYQQIGDPFESKLSFIDVLFNVGQDSRKFLL